MAASKETATLTLVDEMLESRESYRSVRIGFGSVGDEDELKLWLNFRWSLPQSETKAQVQRIFREGDRIEHQVLSDMKKAGLAVYDIDPATGKQYTYYYHGGHFIGKVDAIVSGMPEVDGEPCAGDIKTAKNTEFNKFVKHGLKEWKKIYFTQINCAAGATGVKDMFLLCEGKNDSDRAIEFFKFDQFHWQSCLSKAKRIIECRTRPPQIYTEDDWQVGKMMSDEQKGVYLGNALPEPNCRNCHYSKPIIDDSIDAKWACTKHQKFIDVTEQKRGCGDHVFLSEFMPNSLYHIDLIDEQQHYKFKDGTELINGNGGGFTSWELYAITKTDILCQSLISDRESLDTIIEVNSGRSAIDVTCKDCLHFRKDECGGGMGEGDCAIEIKQPNYYPSKKRDCKGFRNAKNKLSMP